MSEHPRARLDSDDLVDLLPLFVLAKLDTSGAIDEVSAAGAILRVVDRHVERAENVVVDRAASALLEERTQSGELRARLIAKAEEWEAGAAEAEYGFHSGNVAGVLRDLLAAPPASADPEATL